MYNLRSRPGIHQMRVSKEAARLEDPKQSQSDKEDHSSDDKESENEESNEDIPKQYGKIYPDLSKVDFIDRSERRWKRNENKYTKLEGSKESYLGNSIFSGITKYIILIIAIIMILIIYFFVTHSANNLMCETPVCLFQDHFKRLRVTFVNQQKLSWKVIGSAVISVINKTVHTQPAVILLIANKNAKEVSSCIANSLASAVEISYGNSADYPKIQWKQYINSKQINEIIYRTFKESFEKENHHVIVLEDLDTFTADAAMTLHLFCDHENAPYKNIVIILTAIVEDFVEDELRLRDMHSIAENHLNKVWKSELWEEKRAALLSRITGSVAVIRSEKNIPSSCYT